LNKPVQYWTKMPCIKRFHNSPPKVANFQKIKYIYINTPHIISGAGNVMEHKGTYARSRGENLIDELCAVLSNNTHDLIWMLDLQAMFIFASPSWKPVLGYDPSSIKQSPFQVYLHPEDKALFENYLLSISDIQSSLPPLQYRIKHSDDTWRWLEGTITPVYEESIMVAFLAIASDITLRKQQEQALQVSHNRIELFLQVSRNMNATLEQRQLMQLIIDNAAAATGFNQGAIYLLQDPDTITLEATIPALPPDFPPEFRSAPLSEHPHITRVIRDRETVKMLDSHLAVLTPAERKIVELRNLRSNLYLPISFRDTTIGVLILCSSDTPYDFSDQEIFLLQGFANQAAQIIDNSINFNTLIKYTDDLEEQIFERKKAEEQLLTEVTRRRVLMEQSRDGIVILDRHGKVLESNKRFAQMLGYSPTEILALNASDWEYGYSHHSLFAMLEAVDEKGDFFQTRHKRKDGSMYDVEISSNAAWFNGTKMIFCVCRDITERKQAEEAQKQLDIARQTIRFKQNFLANMSHEIRTPLTGVLGMMEIMENTPLTPLQHDYIQTMKVSGENLREIINQVLDYSKIEAGKLTIKPAIFEFASLLSDAQMLYKNITRPTIRLSIQTDAAIPEYIIADRNRLSQVLNNLVSNAIKFTPGGNVVIRTELMSRHQSGVEIKIYISDTGIGIASHQLEKLFKPFTQIDDADTRGFEGTGLGLSICRDLVTLMGGQIGVNSELEKGSTFWFTFPATIPPEQPIKPATGKSTSMKVMHLNILLAEDKPINQKVIKLMLNALGHQVTVASQGLEVISMYESGKFDLILMDIQMPLMDGMAATRELRRLHTSLPPIVGLSANAFEGDREKYMSEGMDDYLTKPVNQEDFVRLVEKLF
jgi:PAS domain S-box-containing protein